MARRHERQIRGRIYDSSRTSASLISWLANEEETIYGHMVCTFAYALAGEGDLAAISVILRINSTARQCPELVSCKEVCCDFPDSVHDDDYAMASWRSCQHADGHNHNYP